MSAAPKVCPPDHKHGAKTTCYANHRCRCDDCKAAWADYDRRRPQRQRAPREEKPFPHGTAGGHRRHIKEGTEPCSPCTEARRAQYREMGNRKRDRDAAARQAAAAQEVGTVIVRDGAIVLEVSADDARMIAAAVLDRALALERQNVHTTDAAAQQGRIDHLRALHKRIATTTRALAA